MSDSNIINNDLLFVRITPNYPLGSWPNPIKINDNQYAIFTNHYHFLPSQLTHRDIAIDLLSRLQKFYSENSQKYIDRINLEFKKTIR